MKTRATIIIPTYGDAPFARWAIQSVQRQTVRDIEICIICDGSPAEMVDCFNALQKEDSRIQVHVFEKSPRTGEPYRDSVIHQTAGEIICYCAHDDLWMPFHIESVEKTLQHCAFTHTIRAPVNPPQKCHGEATLFRGVHWIDINHPVIRKRMQSGQNFFGLTCGAHTRRAYEALKEGWATTPLSFPHSDLYMWRKFLDAFPQQCQTTRKVTILNFPKPYRKHLSAQQRQEELKEYSYKIQDPEFLNRIDTLSRTFPEFPLDYFSRLKLRLRRKIRSLF